MESAQICSSMGEIIAFWPFEHHRLWKHKQAFLIANFMHHFQLVWRMKYTTQLPHLVSKHQESDMGLWPLGSTLTHYSACSHHELNEQLICPKR